MKQVRLITLGALLAGLAVTSFAGTSATGTLRKVGSNGSLTNYRIDLSNTGTTLIKTFWYAWIPGEDYLPARPSAFGEPATWSAPVVTGPASPSPAGSNGDAIRWESATGLAAGQTGAFLFSIAATPSVLAGNSIYHAHPPIGTSFIYSGIFPSGTGTQFVVQSVPSPSAGIAMAFGVVGLLVRRKRRS